MTAGTGAHNGLFGGRYAIGSVIGVGASASVYEAEDVRAAAESRRLALKILHPHLADRPEVRDAFLLEASRARGLQHPNVVAVHGCGLHDAGGVTLAWIALDLVEGPSLADWVAEHGRMTVPEAAAVALGTLAALGTAHQLGIVHRDVTPRNIMLARRTDEPIAAYQVRVLDFGLADAAGATTVGGDVLLAGNDGSGATVVGSAHYMSPEQTQGLPIAATGDLYQTGAVLHFLLTARPPYPRDTLEQVLTAQVAAPPPVPSALVPSASPLDRVVTKAMAKEPSRRYPDAYSFGVAVRGALASLALSGHGYQPTMVMGAAPSRPVTSSARMPDAASTTPRQSGAGSSPVTAGSSNPTPTRGPTRAPSGPPSSARVPPRPSLPSVQEPERGPAAGLAIAGIAVVAVLAVASAIMGNQSAAAPLPGVTSPASLVPSPVASPSPSPSPANPVLVTVPTLHGTLADVHDELRRMGLRLGRVTRIDSAAVAGQILEQSPDAGLQVAWGSVVKVDVASGFNSVPAVAELSYDQAVSALRGSGFRCTDAPQPIATILGTTPAAGTRAQVDTPVALVWSDSVAPSPTPESPSPGPSEPGG